MKVDPQHWLSRPGVPALLDALEAKVDVHGDGGNGDGG